MEIKELLNEIKRQKGVVSDFKSDMEHKKCQFDVASADFKMCEHNLKWMMEQLDELIRGGDQQAYIDKIEMEGCEIKVRKMPPMVIVTNIEVLPEKFVTYTPKADKKRIKKALQSGKIILGAEMREEEYKLICEVV